MPLNFQASGCVCSPYGGIPGISDAECLKSLKGSLLQSILYRLVISTLHSIGLVFLVHCITPKPLRHIIIFCDVGFFFCSKWGLGHNLPQWHFTVWCWEDSLMTDKGFCRCKACWTSIEGSCRTEAAKWGSDKLFSKIHLRFASEGSSCLIPRGAQQHTNKHAV